MYDSWIASHVGTQLATLLNLYQSTPRYNKLLEASKLDFFEEVVKLKCCYS